MRTKELIASIILSSLYFAIYKIVGFEEAVCVGMGQMLAAIIIIQNRTKK